MDDRVRRQSGRRGRLSSAKVRVFDSSVPSPCIAVCDFRGEPYCQGCHRTADEIREWMIYSREEKLSVLDKVLQRKKDHTS